MNSSDEKKDCISEEASKKRRKLIVTEKDPAEYSVKFDGSYFRKLIKGDHPLGAVRQLLAVVRNTNDSIIDEFLHSGGSALELILILDKLENKTYYHHYQPVFSVLSLVINKVRDELPRLLPNTEEACRRLLRCHTSILHSMLASASIQAHKKVVLEMLTAMVTLSVQLAREVLSTLSLREVTMNDLAKHPVKYECNSTRAHFIRYILAYFYHDANHLVKQLLDQRYLLQCLIFAGLTTDDVSLLTIFLSTLKEKIVENIAISKTTKLKMFNTKIMMKLLETYTWTGPDLQKKKNSKDSSCLIVNEDLQVVINCLHQLLVLLCTNHKLGVAFVDPSVGLDQKNYNDLVFSVIKSMDPYWNISWVRDLALKIVLACPDLVAPTFRHLGLQEFLHPDVSLSFVHTCDFAKKVIDELVPERCLTVNGSVDQLTHLTTRTVFNMNVVNCVRASLLSVHPTIRLQAVNLLNSTFQSLQRFNATVNGRFSSAPKNVTDFRQRITDHITKNIGFEEELMVAWSLGVAGDQSILRIPTETDYYLPFIDLLLSYNQVFPMYLPTVFISKLQKTQLDTINSDTKDVFHIKIIKFILIMKKIQPSQTEFNEMIETLVPLLSKWGEARTVLKSLLSQTGYFEEVESEVEIWVMNMALFSDCNCHLSLLLSVLNEVVSKPKRCLKMLEQSNVTTDSSGSIEFNWSELIEVAKYPSKGLTHWQKMLPSTRLSILVPALVRILNSNDDVDNICDCKFIPHLLGDIFFSQVDHSTYYQMIKSCTSPLVEPLRKYAAKWNSTEESYNILKHQPFTKHSPEYFILKILSSDSFSDEDPLKLLGTVEPETMLVLVRLVVFHSIRMGNQDTVDRCCSVIEALVSQLSDLTPLRQSSLQEIFLHPIILQRFNPLQPSSASNLAPLVLSLTSLVRSEDQYLLKPYKLRFLTRIQKAIKKGKNVKRLNLVDTCTKLITQNDEVVALLSTIGEFQPGLSEWDDVSASLLQTATTNKYLLPGEVITVLSQHNTLHLPLVDYLKVFPHLIEYINTDLLTRQEQLSQLCYLVLQFDYKGTVQRSLLKSYKNQPHVLFPALAVTGKHADPFLHKQVKKLIRCVSDSLSSSCVPDWLSENSHTIGLFISELSDEKCGDVYSCLKILQTWDTPHLDIARHVYIKLEHVVEFVVKVLNILVSLTVPTTLTRAEAVCRCLREVIMEVKTKEYDWEPVRMCDDWAKWTKLALKLGESLEHKASFLLTTLTALTAVVYSQQQKGVAVLTEMVFSHSQFLTVMLAKPSSIKTALLELILTLLQVDPSIMTSTHVPIYLSAYSASLSESDQLLLQLLQLYESNGVSLAEWKPFLWGETAASFYSVRSQIGPGLWNKQNFSQLLDLFDESRVNKTITNYPIDRALKTKEKCEEQSDVYDPAFYLPMLISMFAPSEIFFTYKTCQSGCLSLVLSALASCHKDVRTLAFVALQRFHCHLLSNTNNQDTLWLHFLDALRRGLKTEENEIPQLNSVISVFLSRTTLVLTNPSHPLYLPLSQFLLAKPCFQLDTVPEMLPLFNSVDVQLHNTHQEWILNVMYDGLRSSEDFIVYLKSMVFKITLEYYSSTLASEKSKILILKILKRAVEVKIHSGQSGGLLLLTSYSLYPWLYSVVQDPALQSTLLTPLIEVLSALLHKSSATFILPLLLHFTTGQYQLTEQQLTAILAALVSFNLSFNTVQQLVDVVDTTVGNVFEHRTMLTNGIKYVTKGSAEIGDARGYLKSIIFNLLQNVPQ